MANPVSALFQRLRNFSRMPAASGGAAVSGRQAAPVIPVLVVSALESDVHAVQDLLRGTRYVPVHAADWSSALSLAGQIVFPIILVDRSLDITDWQVAVKRLVNSWGSPSVLLLSQTGEDGLRDELIRSGALGILVRPLVPGEVFESLGAAIAR